jgi:1-acyl-sn-glycerol-3-phosphate acyltransferase
MTNHQSYFDIFALLANLPVDFKFVLKQELMKIPLLGFSMRRAGYIGIEREDPRKAIQSINKAVEKIKNGASVLIFPEGTRSIDGRIQAFKKGGFNLALRSDCDIVPVTISGSHHIVQKGSLKINKGSFRMHIGKPISVKGYDKRNVTQLMEKVRDAMLSQVVNDGNDKYDNA